MPLNPLFFQAILDKILRIVDNAVVQIYIAFE